MARGARLLLLLAFLSVLVAVLLQLYRLRKPRLWTVDELSRYNGTDEGLPILLGILGYLYFSLASHSPCLYQCLMLQKGGHTMALEEVIITLPAGMHQEHSFLEILQVTGWLTDSLQDLSSMEVNSIVDWRKMYFEKYIYAGKLVGRYYDSQGNPTKYLKGVEVKAKRGAQLLEKQKSEEAKIPSCNSKWSEQEGGEVWCETGYPRLVRRPGDIALTGKVSQRCACFQEAELNKPGLLVYEGCDYLSKSCKV